MKTRLSVLSLLSAAIVSAAVVPYPATPGAVSSAVYAVEVDGQTVPVEHFKDVSYARFAADGPVNVVVKVAQPFREHVLRPVRLEIPVRREGNELRFTLPAPRKLVLQCEGLEKLFLFADAPEVDAPRLGDPGVVNVRDYLTDASGRTLQRDQIQRALDAVAARPQGGVLYFPAGLYLTGTLVVRSHTTVYLEPGALLQGTGDPRDYYVPPIDGVKPGRSTGALLYFLRAEGSRLIGRGTVAGRGTEIRKLVSDHPRICNLVESRDCEIADIVIRDSGGFNLHARRCENIRFHGYKIVNDLSLSNQDGTDPDSSSRIVVDDVFMYTSDDAIAIKADVGICQDVVVKNCVFWTKKSALKVGSDPAYGARNITFVNNDVLHADRAVAVYARRGFAEDIVYRDNTAEYVGDDIKRQTIVILVSDTGPGGEKSTGRTSPYTGYINGVTIDGLVAWRRSDNPSVVRGEAPGHTVSNVTIRNYFLAGRPVNTAPDGAVAIGPFADGVRFEVDAAAPAFATRTAVPAWAH